MSETISGYHNTLQRLGTATPSVTISGTIKAGASLGGTGSYLSKGYGAVYGPRSGHFTISNFGLIDDTAANPTLTQADAGIVLGAFGTVNNFGTILAPVGEAEGIYLYRGGDVTNSGKIIGQQQGIFVGANTLSTGQDFVDNTGYIDATTKPFTVVDNSHTYSVNSVGVFVLGAGTIENAAGATIDARYGLGIELFAGQFVNGRQTASAGALINAGTVNAAYGVYFYGAGSFTNSGKIIATKTGAEILSSEAVINSGSIIGGNAGIIAYAAATISNSGSIESSGTAGFSPVRTIGSGLTLNPAGVILLKGGVISNTSAGIISATGGYGIELNLVASVANAGVITGAEAGILAKGEAFITNSGTIDATGSGRITFTSGGATLSVADTAIFLMDGGSVSNSASGIISGSAGQGVNAEAGATIVNAGQIAGQHAGILENWETTAGTALISNSGTISATGKALEVHGITFGASAIMLVDGGTVDNLTSGKIISREIGVTGTSSSGLGATIVNSGLIETTGTTSVTAGTVSFFPIAVELITGGAVSNSSTGSIIGGEGIVGFAGSAAIGIINSGLIEATGTTLKIGTVLEGALGVFLVDGGTLTNQAGGTIIGYGAGVDSFYDLGPGERTRNSTIATSIVNNGLIEGSNSTISFTNGTVISSSGGVVLNGGGTLINQASGTISGHFGVYINGGSAKIANGVDNLGTIIGVSEFGILLGQNASLVNAGHISGHNYGAFLYAANQLTNSGTITGTVDGVLANNGAGQAATLTNSGLIESTGTALVTSGTFTFSPVGVKLLAGGTVTNAGGTIIGTGVGILLDGGAVSGSTVINTGLVTAQTRTFVNGTNTYASSGIVLGNGGFVTNAASGTISGAEIGLYFNTNESKAAGTLLNAGLIETTGGTVNNHGLVDPPTGVVLKNGGTVTNQSSGTISGFNGIYLSGGIAGIPGFIDNLGIITGTADSAVLLEEAGSLTNSGHITGALYGVLPIGSNLVSNLAGGTISGAHAGILAYNTAGLAATIENAGEIIATGSTFVQSGQTVESWGAELFEGGTFANAATGTLSGDGGFQGAGTTLVNAGTIIGRGGIAVKLFGTNDRLIDDPGAVFSGTVSDSTGTGILELAAGSKAGSIASFNTQFSGFSTVDVDTGASWDFAGSIPTLLNNGSIAVTGTTGLITGFLVNAGSIVAASGNAVIGTAGAKITNQGLISGTASAGIVLSAGGSLSNSGHIAGGSAGFGAYGEAFVSNSGIISATGTNLVVDGITFGAAAVAFGDGGTVNNQAGGEIIALEIGISNTSASGIGATITNDGLIEVTGTSSAKAGTLSFSPIAIDLGVGAGGGTVSNASTGTIIGGGIGILLGNTAASGMEVFNSGLITGDKLVFVNGASTYGSTGIVLRDGGSVTNTAAGTISGAEAGIVFVANTLKAAGSVLNGGVIAATGGTINNDGVVAQPVGIVLDNGGSVTNQSTGVISGFNGIATGGTAGIAGVVDNLGTIIGSGGNGVVIDASGSLTNSGLIAGHVYGVFLGASTLADNLASGKITGSNAGILAANGSSLTSIIENAGAIIATGTTFVENGKTDFAWGAELIEGGTFSNAATGTLSGYAGFVGQDSTTIINAGTITGRGGLAIVLTGTNDKVVDDPGAVFNGLVYDGNGTIAGTGILELAAGSVAGTIVNFNSQFEGFSMVSVDTGASWDLAGTIATLLNNGTLAITAGSSLDVSTSISAASAGIFLLSGKAVLEIAAVLGTSAKIEFLTAAAGGTLAIDNSADFGLNVGKTTYAGPLLEDFKAGDVIDLRNVAAAGLKLNYNAATGDLQITASGGGVLATLQFQNSSLGAGTFQSAADTGHGALITLS